jgi:hypothetical protein
MTAKAAASNTSIRIWENLECVLRCLCMSDDDEKCGDGLCLIRNIGRPYSTFAAFTFAAIEQQQPA